MSDAKSFLFTNHSLVTDLLDSILPDTDPDCILYSEDGYEARIHKVCKYTLFLGGIFSRFKNMFFFSYSIFIANILSNEFYATNVVKCQFMSMQS